VTKRISLDRLRDISKQRSIRPQPVRPDPGRTGDDEVMATIEWPVPNSSRC
jgi:hypothetical protein